MKLLRTLLFFSLTLLACPKPQPQCPSRADDQETPAELSTGDACHRAGENLKKACPKMWRDDWDDFCHTMVNNSIPLCPAKLAKVKSCAEADKVCR